MLLNRGVCLVKSSGRSFRHFSTSSTKKEVAILMLNMGGPSSLDGEVDGVGKFLRNLFNDSEIIGLGPFQDFLAPYISDRRTPAIRKQYDSIGGKSPIGEWTEIQSRIMLDKLRSIDPSTSYSAYTAFRYAPPSTESALLALKENNIKRVVAFSQYPHYSCTTVGSSLNHLWRECIRLGLENEFEFSVIDRWHSNPKLIEAIGSCIAQGLSKFAEGPERDSVVIVFSAHSVPMLTVNKGDPYVSEINATVHSVMSLLRSGAVQPDLINLKEELSQNSAVLKQALDRAAVETSNGSKITDVRLLDPKLQQFFKYTPSGSQVPPSHTGAVKNPFVVSWQSKVGFLPWMGPSTASTIEGLSKQGIKNVLVVPVAFTSDHIETLFEIDQEYKELAHSVGLRLERCPALNAHPLLTDALAELVFSHVKSGRAVESDDYGLKCGGCTNPACRNVLSPVPTDSASVYLNKSDAARGLTTPSWPSVDVVEVLKARKEPCK